MRILESSAMQLARLKMAGSVCVSTDAGTFEAIFDAAYISADGVDETSPALSACRSCDLTRLQLRKGSRVTVGAESFQVRSIEPDGTGISVVRLAK